MNAKIKQYVRSSFAVQATLFFALLSVLTYLPVFWGKIPLPMDDILNFPLWDSIRGPKSIAIQHAQLGDLVTAIYPWRAYAGEAIRQGVMPLWNPHILLGTPFLADQQSSVFYPPNIVFYLFPAHVGWVLSLMLRPILAGVFTALLTRSLGVSKLGALSAGVVFSYSGFLVTWQGWPLADAGVWLPLVCLSVEGLRRQLTLSSAALAGAAFAMPVLAGHPEIALFVILAGTLFAAYRLLWNPDSENLREKQRVRFIVLFSVAGILAMALAAVQVLPGVEWLGNIKRSLDIPGWGARPLSELVGFLSRDANNDPNSAGIRIPEGATYSGILTLLSASLSVLNRKKADVIFFFLLLISVLQIIYGFGPVSWMADKAPVLRALPNWRMILIANFSLAVLAGFGISALEELRHVPLNKRKQMIWWILLCVAGSLLAYGTAELYSSGTGPDYRWPTAWLYGPQSTLVLALVTVALLSPLAARFVPWRVVGPLILLLVTADLLTFSFGHIPFFSRDQIYPEPFAYQKFKEKDRSLYRIVSVDMTMPANAEMVYGLYSPSGYDFQLSSTMNILSPLTESGSGSGFSSDRVIKYKGRLMDLMNVKYLVANTYNGSAAALLAHPERFPLAIKDGAVYVFENPSVLPRAFLVPASAVEVIPKETALLDRLASPTFDSGKAVLLAEAPAWPGNADSVQNLAALELSVRAVHQGINDFKASTDANVPSVLVLSDMYYPGWKVLVDGSEEKLLRVDYALKGVALRAGSHEVRFVFEPLSFRIGALVSALALVGLVAVTAGGGRIRRWL